MTKILVINPNARARGIQTSRDLQILSYETLVDILLSENTKVYNF